ncbi:glycosyltransferase family 4 protein [Pseudomonas sp. F(2018)]|uniref:MraY family glycosyltransferase n=1 Tax=Pseudomonas sp. F(2018) TaxID=2502240 RepID=UPI0010F6885D|nr:glycosyltransferase family 4 protein [Pseudomonas sp. F(2018)]
MISLITIAVAVLLACSLTALLRRYALAKSLLDIPNARSSHTLPTPRGGGVAIVVTFLLGLVALYRWQGLPLPLFLALAGGGGGVALLGFLDDHGHVAARWRLLGHFLAAAWSLYWLGGLPPILAFGTSWDMGLVGQGGALLYLVWLLNLYNFMDGIDGIAGVEAISVCLGAALLSQLSGATELVPAVLVLAAACSGFLFWNFPPAKIFMGDAGSGFLGITLGVLSLQATWVDGDLLWCWLILLGVFIVDATLTLLRRLLRGEKVYEAHRSHAYQFAARLFNRHLPVTLGVLLINLFWLLPIAASVALDQLSGPLALALAYAPLIALAIKYRAGLAEPIEHVVRTSSE